MDTFLSRVISFYRSSSKISDERVRRVSLAVVYYSYTLLQLILLLKAKFKHLELVSYINRKGNYVFPTFPKMNNWITNVQRKII